MCRAIDNFVMTGEFAEEECAKCEAALRAKLDECRKKKGKVKQILHVIKAQTEFVWEPNKEEVEKDKKR